MTDLKTTVKEIIGVQEIIDKSGILWKAAFAEFIGNTLLNFFGGASCLGVSDPTAVVEIVRIALAFGFLIFVLVLAIGHVSGGHLNPAVTLAFLVTGRISVLRAFLYIIVQCCGAIAGSALLKVASPNLLSIQSNLGATEINQKLSPFQGLMVEFLLGFILVFVVFAVSDPNRPFLFVMAPLGVGLTIAAGHLAVLDFTGSAMNPARALGSAVLANQWGFHWVYWLGPIVGGILAGIIYFFVFSAPSSATSEQNYQPVPADENKSRKQAV